MLKWKRPPNPSILCVCGGGQLLGRGKAVSLLGYIPALTNNVLLEATNLFKQTNPEEEVDVGVRGRGLQKVSKLNVAAAPSPLSALPPTSPPQQSFSSSFQFCRKIPGI